MNTPRLHFATTCANRATMATMAPLTMADLLRYVRRFDHHWVGV